MNEAVTTLIINAIATPAFVLITMWVRNSFSREAKRDARDEKFVLNMEKRIEGLERDIREVRVELKNRDEEYLKLYKEWTTLKAKHEVLQADHEDLKNKYEHTVAELARLGNTTIK